MYHLTPSRRGKGTPAVMEGVSVSREIQQQVRGLPGRDQVTPRNVGPNYQGRARLRAETQTEMGGLHAGSLNYSRGRLTTAGWPPYDVR